MHDDFWPVVVAASIALCRCGAHAVVSMFGQEQRRLLDSARPISVVAMCILAQKGLWVFGRCASVLRPHGSGRKFGADAVIMTGISRVIVLWINDNSADKTLHGARGALRTANISVLSRGLISASCVLSAELG